MIFEKFTIKAQESIKQAIDLADNRGQQAIECAHLLKGIITEAESIVSHILAREIVAGIIDRDQVVKVDVKNDSLVMINY